MSESVVADFVGRFATSDIGDDPVRGRVLLSREQLVLATEDTKLSVPLSSVFDITIGDVPDDLAEFFRDTMTVAYEQGGARDVVAIEAESDTMEKFTTVMFRALLHGAEVVVIHPDRVGGRVKDTPPAPAALDLRRGELRFDGPRSFRVDLSTVTEFRRSSRKFDDEERPAVEVRHLQDGTAVRSVVGMDSTRRLNLLGRFLRREYDELWEETEDIDLTEEQVEALIGLYSAGGSADLTAMLDGDPSRTSVLLNRLTEAGLVVDGPEGTELTSKGRIVVNSRLESVNR